MQPDQNQVTGLITELGLDGLSQEEKDKLVNKLAETLQNRIFTAVMQLLNDEEKSELNKIAESGDDNQIIDYLTRNVPELEAISSQEYEKLRNEMLQTNEEISEAIKNHNPAPDESSNQE